MLQLHLSGQQFYCLIQGASYIRDWKGCTFRVINHFGVRVREVRGNYHKAATKLLCEHPY